MTVWIVVVAAGSGTRFGGPKQYELLGSSRVVDRSIATACRVADRVALVVAVDDRIFTATTPPRVERVAEQPAAAPMALVSGDLREATENYQRQLISACLERHHDNWASAARELGLDRANLGRMAKRLGMK